MTVAAGSLSAKEEKKESVRTSIPLNEVFLNKFVTERMLEKLSTMTRDSEEAPELREKRDMLQARAVAMRHQYEKLKLYIADKKTELDAATTAEEKALLSDEIRLKEAELKQVEQSLVMIEIEFCDTVYPSHIWDWKAMVSVGLAIITGRLAGRSSHNERWKGYRVNSLYGRVSNEKSHWVRGALVGFVTLMVTEWFLRGRNALVIPNVVRFFKNLFGYLGQAGGFMFGDGGFFEQGEEWFINIFRPAMEWVEETFGDMKIEAAVVIGVALVLGMMKLRSNQKPAVV